MGINCAHIDHAVRGRASAQLNALTPTTADVTKTRSAIKYVIGPDGRRLSLADLPLPNTKRWVIRRKAEVVAAVRGGLLSLDEACRRYRLNSEEIMSWQRRIDRFGVAGLRTTRIQFYLEKIANAERQTWLQH